MKTSPIGSADFQRLNPHLQKTKSCPLCGYCGGMPFHTCHASVNDEMKAIAVKPQKESPSSRVVQGKIILAGQVRGGKNNMGVSRTGQHYPKGNWKEWRDSQVRSVKIQLPKGFVTIAEPINVRLDYVAGDKRRRDFPAICDAIWHVLEKAGVVEDDTLLWPAESTRAYDKQNPRAAITFLS